VRGDYDETVALMAATIAAGMMVVTKDDPKADADWLRKTSVEAARAIVEEVQATEPKPGAGDWTITESSDVTTEQRKPDPAA